MLCSEGKDDTNLTFAFICCKIKMIGFSAFVLMDNHLMSVQGLNFLQVASKGFPYSGES